MGYIKFLILLTILFFFPLAGIAKQPAGELLLKDSILTDGQRYVKELKIYPNPTTTGKVNLEITKGEISEIYLTDITGKKVLTKKTQPGNSRCEIAVNEIPDGIYFIRVKSSENKIFVKKLVVSGR